MHKRIGLLLLAGLVLLPGCYRVSQYRSKSLRFIDDNSGYHASKNGFISRVKRLTNYDKKELFGQYSKKLERYAHGPIEVIYVSLHNLSSQVYILPSRGIDLEIIPHREIEKLMKTSTVGRIVGFIGSYLVMAASGFFGWAGLWIMTANNAPTWTTLIPLFGAGGVIAGGIYAGKYSQSIEQSIKANGRIIDDLEDKALLEGITIRVGEKYEGLIFVKPLNYRSLFNITLHEKEYNQNKVIFDIDLQQC